MALGMVLGGPGTIKANAGEAHHPIHQRLVGAFERVVRRSLDGLEEIRARPPEPRNHRWTPRSIPKSWITAT